MLVFVSAAGAGDPVRIVVDPAQAPRAGVVSTLEAAIADAAKAAADTPAIEITMAPGVHEVLNSVRVGRLPAPVLIRGAGGTPTGTRLVGGVVVRTPLAEIAADDPIHGRLTAEAIRSVRWVDVTAVKEGQLLHAPIAGPVRHGMNLPAGAGSELYFNGRPLTPACWPNAGFARFEAVVDPGTSKERPNPDEPLRGGTFRVADKSRLQRWAATPDVWLTGYWHWDWADDTMPAGNIDPGAGTITLGLPHTYGLGKDGRWAVMNIPEELDAPGEYWLDPTTGRAYLWPPGGAGTESPELTVSLLADPMVVLDGAADVVIEGVMFEAGRGLAVKATGVENVRIERCAFRNTGTGAIELEGRANVVRGCSFEDVGAAGVAISGGDRASLTHAGNRVEDCTFRRCGRTHRTYQPAVRIDGVGQVVANNLIEDLPHCAMIFAGNEHIIELNDISRVLLETGDSGAIYCGRDWTLHGTVIRNNLFHKIEGTDARYQNAVYLDDMASGITVEGNVFVRCHWGMLIGGGRDIRIRGNVFDSCGMGMSFDKRGVGWMAKNIADPAKSTLHERLRSVPIDREPWNSRYPSLGSYLTDRFGRPVGGDVSGNVFLSTSLGRVDDRECVRLDGNVERKEPLNGDVVANMLDPVRRRGMSDLVPSGAPEGFVPIPVGRIGPRAQKADEPGTK